MAKLFRKEAVIKESDLFKLKKIFWKYNILGFAPFLKATVETEEGQKVEMEGTWFDKRLDIRGEKFKDFSTGVKNIAPWWKVQGSWLSDQQKDNGALIGVSLAEKMKIKTGDNFNVIYQGRRYGLKAQGILTTGGPEDNRVITDLQQMQSIINLPDRVSEIQVSALIKPDDKLALKYKDNPKSLSSQEYITWYCSPYIDAIAFQINEVFPEAVAKPIPSIAQAEGKFLNKMQLMMFLVTTIALIASSLGVMATMTTNIMERRKEIGMIKAIGAQELQVLSLFSGELGLIGFLGGGLGYLVGIEMARLIGTWVFETVITPNISLLPITVIIALAITALGSISPIKKALKIDPAVVLRGD